MGYTMNYIFLKVRLMTNKGHNIRCYFLGDGLFTLGYFVYIIIFLADQKQYIFEIEKGHKKESL